MTCAFFRERSFINLLDFKKIYLADIHKQVEQVYRMVRLIDPNHLTLSSLFIPVVHDFGSVKIPG